MFCCRCSLEVSEFWWAQPGTSATFSDGLCLFHVFLLRRATMPSMCAGANWVGKQWLGGFMVSVSPSKWWVHPISDPNHFKYAHYVPRRMNHYVILRPIMAIMLLISKSGYRKLYIYICIPKYPWNQHIINRHIYLVCWELQWICCMGLTQMGTVDLAWPHPLDQKLRISWKLAPRCSWMWSWKKKSSKLLKFWIPPRWWFKTKAI